MWFDHASLPIDWNLLLQQVDPVMFQTYCPYRYRFTCQALPTTRHGVLHMYYTDIPFHVKDLARLKEVVNVGVELRRARLSFDCWTQDLAAIAPQPHEQHDMTSFLPVVISRSPSPPAPPQPWCSASVCTAWAQCQSFSAWSWQCGLHAQASNWLHCGCLL